MKKIIIIKNCNEDNLKLHRVNYTSDLLDILFDNIIKELSLERAWAMAPPMFPPPIMATEYSFNVLPPI